MLITALTKFTALDFPGKLACIIFTGGCNLRCGFCHNAEFVLPDKLSNLKNLISFDVVMSFLKHRVGLLDGVVICGGEPTVQVDLADKIRLIKKMGFAVKLDTNGSNPVALERLISESLIDYVAMDLKDNIPYRKALIGVSGGEHLLLKSLKTIKTSGINHEFRTTILPDFHDLETLREMSEIVGNSKWYWQKFRSGKTLNEKFGMMKEPGMDEMERMKEVLGLENVMVRG